MKNLKTNVDPAHILEFNKAFHNLFTAIGVAACKHDKDPIEAISYMLMPTIVGSLCTLLKDPEDAKQIWLAACATGLLDSGGMIDEFAAMEAAKGVVDKAAAKGSSTEFDAHQARTRGFD
jgi:hypothetical protein